MATQTNTLIVDKAREVYLKYRGEDHREIEREMHALGYTSFTRRVLYSRRYKNGTFNPGCDNIGQQSLAIFERLGRVTVRDVYVDERMGIVLMRLSWNQRGPGSDKLTAFEMFKVYDGQIHMVEAWIRLFPPAQELGGWPVAVAQPE